MNMKTMTTSIITAMVVLTAFAAITMPASAAVEVQIGMALDGSGSIGSADWGIIVNGVADAVDDSACVHHDGTVELTVVSFPGGLQVGPVVITSTNAAAVATSIRAITYPAGSSTPMAAGISDTADAMSGSPHFDPAIKQVINIATDGVPTDVAAAELARDNAITTLQMTTQDEIDAEGIGITDGNRDWLRDEIVYPQPGNIATVGMPATYIPGWVCVVVDAQEFADSMCEKFKRIPPPEEVPAMTSVGMIVGMLGLLGLFIGTGMIRGRR